MKVETIKSIAKSKGLNFYYDINDNTYVMKDAKTGQILMLYDRVTVETSTSEKIWREECNKLRNSNW